MNVSGVIFFPSRAKETKKQKKIKKITPDLRLGNLPQDDPGDYMETNLHTDFSSIQAIAITQLSRSPRRCFYMIMSIT